MRPRVAIVYNEPLPGRYEAMGEGSAVLGVLEEVEAVQHTLAGSGFPVVRIPLLPPLERAEQTLRGLEVDLVFNLFEGFDGQPETEAAVPDMLSALGISYTGCSGAALSLALDKARVKALLEAAGLATPGYCLLSPGDVSGFCLGYPCIVKPCAEDASHGISERSVVNDAASLEEQVATVSASFGGKALVEEYVEGREFNVTVLGNGRPVALPISEIAYSLPPGMPGILTFSAKWEPDSLYYQCSNAVCPAHVGAGLRERIADAALSIFSLLGCSGYARADIRLDPKGRLKVIEVNPNPDISPGSGAARQAQAAGMTYEQFIERIALLGLERTQL